MSMVYIDFLCAFCVCWFLLPAIEVSMTHLFHSVFSVVHNLGSIPSILLIQCCMIQVAVRNCGDAAYARTHLILKPGTLQWQIYDSLPVYVLQLTLLASPFFSMIILEIILQLFSRNCRCWFQWVAMQRQIYALLPVYVLQFTLLASPFISMLIL